MRASRWRALTAAVAAVATGLLLNLGGATAADTADPPAAQAAAESTQEPAQPASEPASQAEPVTLDPAADRPDENVETESLCSTMPEEGYATCLSVRRTDLAGPTGRLAPNADPNGYGPTDLRDAYDLPSTTAGEGATVAVVVAHDAPTAEEDLAVYRAQFGLPPCTTENGCFRKVDQNGGTDYPAADAGWAGEAALDLDMVSAICPNCDILLVEADDAGYENLSTAVATAVRLGAKYVSNSWGGLELRDQAELAEEYYNHPGVVITASSGNFGYHPTAPYFPASSKYVTAVGGTSLMRADNARGWTETAWSGASSGCSRYTEKPEFQTDSECPRRTVADVSAIADPATGVAVYHTYQGPGWLVLGGTSTAAPIIAATYALAGQPGSNHYPNTYPYATPDALNDVTEGSTGNCDVAYFCSARAGYDGPTGLGTPSGLLAFRPAGPQGDLVGTVRDGGTGDPIENARVSAGGATVLTDEDGDYALTLPVGTYDLTVSAFGYEQVTIPGLDVVEGGTLTRNVALAAQDTVTVSGVVSDGSGHGWPLYAKVVVEGTPVAPVHTNPFTGRYSVTLPVDADYTLTVTPKAQGYRPVEVLVSTANGHVDRDVAAPIDDQSCNAPGYRLNYVGTTENFESPTVPEGWTVTDNNGPGGGTWTFDNPLGRGNLTGGGGNFADMYSFQFGFDAFQDTDLISPVLDLSDHANPVINFRTNYVSLRSTADVDLSLDGGQTWETVFHRGSDPSERIDGEGHIEVPVPQAAGQDDVRVKFHFTGHVLGWWQVDKVFVGNRSCDPVQGGIVLGRVRDANTGAALDGATVAVGEATTTTASTPDDGALADGFYRMFAPGAGRTEVSVSQPAYQTSTRRVNLAPNWVTRHDVSLRAGRLEIRPGDLAVTQKIDRTRTRKITFENTGTAPVTVELGEAGGTPAVLGQRGAPLHEVQGSFSPLQFEAGRMRAASVDRAANPSAAAWQEVADYPAFIMDNAVAVGPDGRVYSVGGVDGRRIVEIGFVYDPATQAWSRIARMSHIREAPAAAFLDGRFHVVGGWDGSGGTTRTMEIYDPATDTWTAGPPSPAGYAGAGVAVLGGKMYVIGGCAQTCGHQEMYVYNPVTGAWSRGADYPTPISWQACGTIAGRIYCAGGFDGSTGVADGFVYDPGEGTWSQIADLPLDLWGGGYTAAAGKLIVSGGVTGFDTLTNRGAAYDPATDTWTAIPNSNNVVYRGGSGCGFYRVGGSRTGDFVPTQGAELLPGFAGCGPAALDWLSLSRTTFTIQPGRKVKVRVRTDSHLDVIGSPGTYAGVITVRTDSPYTVAPVDVSMHAKPPRRWGEIEGVVMGRACDGSVAPLAGATVQINTWAANYTLRTDEQGRYSLWLDRRHNPLRMIVAKDGWQPQTARVRIKAGKTRTRNFTLEIAGWSCN